MNQIPENIKNNTDSRKAILEKKTPIFIKCPSFCVL